MTALMPECHRTARDDGLAAGLSLLCAKLLPGSIPCGSAGTAVLPADIMPAADRARVSVRTVLSHGLTPRSGNYSGALDRSVREVVHGEVASRDGRTSNVGRLTTGAGRTVSDAEKAATEARRPAAPETGRLTTLDTFDLPGGRVDVLRWSTAKAVGFGDEHAATGLGDDEVAADLGEGASVVVAGRAAGAEGGALVPRDVGAHVPAELDEDVSADAGRDIWAGVDKGVSAGTGRNVWAGVGEGVSVGVGEDVWAAWTLGLVWVRLGLSEALRDSCVRYLRGRHSGDSTLLQQQLVKGALADALAEQLEIRAVLTDLGPGGVTPLLVNGLNRQITQTDRALLRLLGATSMVVGGPGEVAYVSELVADAYLLEADTHLRGRGDAYLSEDDAYASLREADDFELREASDAYLLEVDGDVGGADGDVRGAGGVRLVGGGAWLAEEDR
jgi:hypothetical protein